MVATAALGLILGAALGALMMRGRICFNAGLRRAAFEGKGTVLRIFAIAIGLQLLLLPLFSPLGVSFSPVGLFPVAQIAGGLVFGAGMALAGGCIAGVLWKTGAGSIAAAGALVGLGAGELLIRGPGRDLLSGLDEAGAPGPGAATLDAVLGLPYEPLAAVLGIIVLTALLARRRDGLGFGLALGALSALAWVFAGWVGAGYGLGFAGTPSSLSGAVTGADSSLVSWSLWTAIGVVAGASIAARGPIRLPDAPRLARALAGGVLMGAGASMAHGCNIGLGLTGIPTLSLGSALAVGCMAVSALAVRRLALEPFPRVRGVERPEPAGW